MRYTTIIDVTEMPAVYRNINARMLYLHMVLVSGYHDDDRDRTIKSIRSLAEETGLTLSACRHAIKVLTQARLIMRDGPVWIVRKYIQEPSITPRAKTRKQQQERTNLEERQRTQQETERKREEFSVYRDKLEQEGKTPFMEYYESLMARADAGDVSAASLVQRHRHTYEEQKAAVEERKKRK